METTVTRAGRSWYTGLSGGLRKQPLQERSRAMVQRVLDTAAALVEQIGYEAVISSPTLLLEESGVSRGSFYAFFETPEQVLDELCFRWMKSATVSLDAMLEERPGRHWSEILDVLFAFYEDEHRLPLIREIWVRQNLTKRVRTWDELWIEDMAGQLLREFERHAPRFEALTTLECTVAIHTLERLFQVAFSQRSEGDRAVIDEARAMLLAYFAVHEHP